MSHSAGASAQAIQRHYDVGNDFYALFLDSSLTYSCAMFEADDSLERAQMRKQDWHIEHSGARGKRRVLDVGCGWGGVLERLVCDYNVEQAVGLTLSVAQREYIAQSHPHAGIQCSLESWADHQPAAPYEAIISVGAFEHFAQYKTTPATKLEAYRHYFRRCRELLEPGGRMTVQTMAYGDIPRDRVYGDEFIANDVFPESDLPRLADIAEACEGEFEIIQARNDRHDYVRTYRLWFERLRAQRAAAVEMAGEETVQRYERYLRTFSYSFALGAFQLLRISFARVDHRRR